MSKAVELGYCGVCCSHCGMQSRIPRMAKELKRFIQAYKYGDWIKFVTQDFEFESFMKGLNWFLNSGCRGCLADGGMPACQVRDCCKGKSIKNCYFCSDFLECEKLRYQKETYKINDNYERIKQISYQKWLKEQEEKSKTGFDNIHFLEEQT